MKERENKVPIRIQVGRVFKTEEKKRKYNNEWKAKHRDEINLLARLKYSKGKSKFKATDKKCLRCDSVLPKGHYFKRCNWCIREIKKEKV